MPTVWVISEPYYPEDVSTGYLLTRIAEGLAEQQRVRVLCSQPTYELRGTRVPWRESCRGVDIRRCWSTTLNKDFLPFRAVNLITFSASVFFRALLSIDRGDVTLVVTNPPSIPFLIMIAGWMRGGKVLLLIHDVYPEVLVAAGFISANSIFTKVLNWFNRRLYRSATQVIVLGRDMYTLAKTKLGTANVPLVIIPNWADVHEIHPIAREQNTFLNKLNLKQKFVVVYSGNMGRTHGLQDIVACAESLGGDDSIHFLLIGSGAGHRRLEEQLKVRPMQNITLLGRQKREDLNDALNAGDVSLISFLPGMAGVSVPSRMYNIMAAGKPIIAVADSHSELATVVREENIGWVIPPGNLNELAAAIQAAKSDPRCVAEMGQRARKAVEEKYTLPVVIGAYRALVDRVLHPEK